MTSSYKDLWYEDRKIFNKFENGSSEMSDMVKLFKERADCEERYATSINKLGSGSKSLMITSFATSHKGAGDICSNRAKEIKLQCITPTEEFIKNENIAFKKLKNDLGEVDKKLRSLSDDVEKLKEKYLKSADAHELSTKKLAHAKLAFEDDTNLEFGKDRFNEVQTAFNNDEKEAKEFESQYKEKIRVSNEQKKNLVAEKEKILMGFQELEEKRIVFHENMCGVYGRVTGITSNNNNNNGNSPGKAELQKWIQQNKSKDKPNLDMFEFVAYKPHYPDMPYEKKSLPEVDLVPQFISLSELMDHVTAGTKQGFREFDKNCKSFKSSYSKKYPSNIFLYDLFFDYPKGLIVASLPPYPVFDPKAKLGKLLEFPHLPVVDKAALKLFTRADNLLKEAKNVNVDPKKTSKKKPENPLDLKIIFHMLFLFEVNDQLKKYLETNNPNWDTIKQWTTSNPSKGNPTLKFMQHKGKQNFTEGGLKLSLWRTTWMTTEKLKKDMYAIEYALVPQESGNDPHEDWVKRCTFIQSLGGK